MKLSRLIMDLYTVEILNFKDVDVSLITNNSGKCIRNSLFVAICGNYKNGEDFIEDAHSRGARVFVSEHLCYPKLDSVVIIVKNARKALAELCSVFFGNPEKKLVTTAITGTKGKTSSAYLLSRILDYSGVKNMLFGTLGALGVLNKSFCNTTPDPTVIYPIIRRGVHKGINNLVLEVSSQAIKEERVFGMPMDCVLYTGISRDHIGVGEHPCFSDYLNSKHKLFTSFGAKTAVVNFDDAYSSYISGGMPRVHRCGFSKGSEYRIEQFKNTDVGSSFYLNGEKIKTSLMGEYNARNIAMALVAALKMYGCTIEKAKYAVENIVIPGRFEKQSVNGRNVIIDYAHNGESFREVMSLSRKVYGGRLISVFGSVGERCFERRRELALAAEKYSDLSVITSDNPGCESAYSICSEICSYFNNSEKARIITDRAEAIRYAYDASKRGDTILILGKGREETMKVNGKDIEYSDFDVVSRLV